MQELAGNLFIISAPSGAGKSSLIQALLKNHNDMQVSVSHTTRAPRPGEQDGVHYHFISVKQFKTLIAQNEFLEWAEVFGNYYGTSKSTIRTSLSQGIDVFLDIDWQGARQIRQQAVITSRQLTPALDELIQFVQLRQTKGRLQVGNAVIEAQLHLLRLDADPARGRDPGG